MESGTKTIHFVSWKKHKVDQALTQIDNVYESFIDSVIFENILDVLRSRAFPAPLPVRYLIANEPVLPPSHRQLQFEANEMRRQQRCPVCKELIDAPRFTKHLEEKCFRNVASEAERISVCRKYFEEEVGQATPT